MKAIAPAILLVLLSACIPAKLVIAPGVNGTIIDKETRLPVTNARVWFEKTPEVSAYTNREGYYALSPVKQWKPFVIMGVPVDYGASPMRLVVSASGYNEVRTEPVKYSPYQDNVITINVEAEKIR